ncbi:MULTISPECIES: LPXTG cell wall anchor domain-containing protein [Streptomycetaceae]
MPDTGASAQVEWAAAAAVTVLGAGGALVVFTRRRGRHN